MQTIIRNVLLLEDEMIIAIDIEDTLRDLGASEIFIADTCEAGLKWLQHHEPSIAIVDPRLKDGFCGPVVRHLVSKGVPFIIYSGDHSAGETDSAFQKGVWLTKPSTPEAMKAAIATFVD